MTKATSANNKIKVEGSIPETVIKTSNQRCVTPGFYKCMQDESKIIKMVKNQAFPAYKKNKVSWVLITTADSIGPVE
jgi:hypothetical protein